MRLTAVILEQLSVSFNNPSNPSTKSDLQVFDQLTQPDWKNLVRHQFDLEVVTKINNAYLEECKSGYQIFPAFGDIFRVFNVLAPDQISVVILGQDPYHAKGQADGLAFSVKNSQPPPSLKNIFKEIESDTGQSVQCQNGDLLRWAQQGVFLLNTLLSVREKEPLSHRRMGWETFTDWVIRIIQQENPAVIFMLWGNVARQKKYLIDTHRHIVLETSHPSPLGYHKSFKNSGQFREVSAILNRCGKSLIQW